MDFGIVYHFENAHQFWLELEDVLSVPQDASLGTLDLALNTFIQLCTNYQDRYLQTNAQMEHACDLLLSSDLIAWHSGRFMDHIIQLSRTTSDPHGQLVLYKLMLLRGQQSPSFFRQLKKLHPLLPLFMDHIRVDIDDNVVYSEAYRGTMSSSLSAGSTSTAMGGNMMGIGVPVEIKLRSLSSALLYEICRSQKLEPGDLKLFTDDFINHLFDLVEATRNHPDETLNYGFIKLIVALNEQFMVASLPPPIVPSGRPKSPKHDEKSTESNPTMNKVLQVLLRRIGDSKTFGENLIFMLNRANGSQEDLCMQLLVLKLLYLIFTTPGMQEYFYTNDLQVLVDVFIREVVDLPDESESLRHTYLRVLHPLLTQTQLRSYPYKRMQIRNVLQSLIAHSHFREVSPTVKRLVDRCLKGEWCRQLEKEESNRIPIPASAEKNPGNTNSKSHLGIPGAQNGETHKVIHRSASIDVIGAAAMPTPTTPPVKPAPKQPPSSSESLPTVKTPPPITTDQPKPVVQAIVEPPTPPGKEENGVPKSIARDLQRLTMTASPIPNDSKESLLAEEGLTPSSRSMVSISTAGMAEGAPRNPATPLPRANSIDSEPVVKNKVVRRSAPAPPVRRRKPPAVPVRIVS